MKRFFTILSIASACVIAFLSSCQQKEVDALEQQLEQIRQRVSELEDVVSAINKNAYAVRVLANTHLMVEKFITSADGITLTLSDGTALDIWFGADVLGIVPIVGIDAEGNWICSFDAGQTFLPIDGADGAFDEYGLTPVVSIDEAGFWIVSFDGGVTFTRMLSPEGTPISALDARQAAGLYSFFSNVEVDEQTGDLIITLKTGATFSIPVVGEFYILVSEFTQGTAIAPGQTLTFGGITVKNVSGAIWNNLPKGWNARLTSDELIITAPQDAAKGTYTLTLMVSGTNGGFRTYDFTLKVQ